MYRDSSYLRPLQLLGLAGAFWSFTCMASIAAGPVKTEASAAAGPNLCPVAKADRPLPYDAALDALSLDELTKRANSGNADAIMLLGLKYAPSPDHDPAAAPDTDVDKAVTLFRKAAKKGQSHAAFLMGVAYLGGSGVEKDEKQAVDWFRRAARNGSPAGQYWLGELMAKGRAGFNKDWEQALPHFKSAAEGGIPDAFIELGYMYSSGRALPMDYEKAAFRFRQVMAVSQIASYNLRSLIDKRFVTWQQGDPGEPVKPETP